MIFLQQLRMCFRLGQDCIDGGVGHAAVHADHRLSDLMTDHTAFLVDRHNTGECQALLPLIQGTDTV